MNYPVEFQHELGLQSPACLVFALSSITQQRINLIYKTKIYML